MIHFLFLQISLLIVNGINFAIVGIDKLQSKKGGWRVPESRLLLIAFLGPFGAYIGMILLDIKLVKSSSSWFVFLLIHVILII